MSYTLVVVDMQPQFPAARIKKCVDNVLAEIEVAKSAGAGIVVLELNGYGPTNKRIAKAVRSYERGYFKTKYLNDGHDEVLRVCDIHDLTRNFRVVGINWSFCVAETAISLRHYGPVTVIKRACRQPKEWETNPHYRGYWRRDTAMKFRRNNVVIA